jgi:protein TonB
MSYKSLLFCPDEKATRLVTQVLSELDFTVELASETYATVKKLTGEHFDALVVDCQDEQNAALLFKAAKNSPENHSSLLVAVVEGQAGVAKAFRIGANLVLTKPINVEQSKSTLRVARGLLKKNQAKPAGASAATITTAPAVLASTADNLIPTSPAPGVHTIPSFNPSPAMSSEIPAHSESFSVLQVEKERTAASEAADVAVLDSLPELRKNTTSPVPAASASPSTMPAGLIGHTGSSAPNFAGFSGGGAAAAAAPALEKKPVELHVAGSAPQFTNEPIVKDADAPEAFEISAAPTFSSLESQAGSEGGKGFLKIAAIFLVVAIGGFFGWQKLQTMHRSSAATTDNSDQTPAPEKIQTPAQSSTTQAAPATLMPPPSASDQATTKEDPEEITLNATTTKAQHNTDPDDIQVQEMPFSRDTKVTVTPKPQPLIVKAGTARPAAQATVALAPPSVDVSAGNSNEAITNLVTSTAQLPKPAPGMIRISQGVSQGLLLKKVPPTYPRMALQLHKEGLVELLATVSKDGRITNIKVLSGDAMLTNAATDAVRQWQYRPYLLNGQPLEVETQITVSFKLPK